MGQHLEDDNKTLKECHIHHKDMIVCQKYIVGKGGQRPNDEDDGGFWADWEDDLWSSNVRNDVEGFSKMIGFWEVQLGGIIQNDIGWVQVINNRQSFHYNFFS